jgi:flagellar M-ring protein FliF
VNPLLAAWTALTLRRRVIVALATVATFAAVLGLARLSTRPDMALLYSGLDPMGSGEVLAALDQEGAAYQVRGTAIYVDAAARDRLRMTLAATGLPASSAEGYEQLDTLSGFGTTAQMFDAAYWRAREGELARTILASPEVRAARVHISAQSGRAFDRAFRPSASVAITSTGAAISPDLARALRFLVAAAVAGLSPDDVAVIDSRSGVVLTAEALPGTDATGRAEALRANVQRLLEARVGPGKAVVEVAVEVGGDSEQLSERKIDPASRVQISTETEERTNTASDQDKSGVTVASNLPSGDGASGGQSQSRTSETRERVNFEVSETRREVTRGPGGTLLITVAVLVDGILAPDAGGTLVWQPRPEAELEALRDLVASAVGYSEARNDQITIRTMQFEPPAELGSPAAVGGGLPFNLLGLAQIGILALVAVIMAGLLGIGKLSQNPS